MRGKKNKNPVISSARAVSGHVGDWEQIATDYVDGRLDAATKAVVRGHLPSCPKCTARIASQQDVLALLKKTAMVDTPVGLEDRILGEVLFPRETAPAQGPAKRASSGQRGTWQGLRAWLPAAAAVVAVLVAVVAYGATRPDGLSTESAASTTAAAFTATAEADEAVEPGEDPAATPALEGAKDGAVSTEAALVLGATGGAVRSEVLQPSGPYLEDNQAMTNGLASTDAPAYFFYVVNDGSLVTAEQAGSIASRVTSATGLQLIDQTSADGMRAFAAFVPREDASAVVELLRSIGASLQLSLNLSLDPGPAVSEWAESLFADKFGLAELSASPSQPPASAGWSYTTSTAPPTTAGSPQAASVPSPDELGTHVLVVILLYVQM
jgi:hypothetical protein